ncbi:MAG: hypothetical protein JXB00_10750 [Bacteroidales bacterium]|nr:hypothetical protein [Bacteroidales bacterium]
MKFILSVNFVCLLFLIIPSCNPEDQVTNSESYPALKIKTNQPPTIVAFESTADTVSICGTLDFTCHAQDPDSDLLYYEWASFKITNESSEDDYDVFYNLNRGEFIRGGEAAIWQPGKLDGKYLIICNVHDKAGYEVDTSKTVNVTLVGCLSAMTEYLTYTITDNLPNSNLLFNPYNRLWFNVRNYKYEQIILEGDAQIEPHVENKIDDKWELYYRATGFSMEEGPPEMIFGEVFKSIWMVPSKPGQYRLFILFNTGHYWEPLTDTLYSNEFEVIE